jgi:hypothetical protein
LALGGWVSQLGTINKHAFPFFLLLVVRIISAQFRDFFVSKTPSGKWALFAE